MVGAPWDGTPFIINPTYTLYTEYLLGISALKGSTGVVFTARAPPFPL